MLIPVRCFTCGEVISDKWTDYVRLTKMYRAKKGVPDEIELLDVDRLRSESKNETSESLAMKELDITKVCCRRHFLCNIDMIDLI
tara:strand:+ start:15429 stop:15683 length:255 start_codon:yes stop_codon:yes gene_type:complete